MVYIGYCFDCYFTNEDFLYVFVGLLSSIFLFVKRSSSLKMSFCTYWLFGSSQTFIFERNGNE